MHCPNCRLAFEAGRICPHCHIDAVLFTGTEEMSNRLYNRGLARLHSLDITGGVRELERAVAVNKHNIRARNLLGLALFELGRIGDGLTHWLISHKQLPENNAVTAYLDVLKKDTRQFERHNEAVVLYNRALEFLHDESHDLAIIQLKKSLEHNPRFLDALNLLTLCYIHARNRPQANAAAERALTIDARNPTATRYHALINPAKPREAPTPARAPAKALPPTDTSPFGKVPDTGPFKPITITERKSTYFHAVGIISFLLGAAVMMAFGFFLYLPAMRRENTLAVQAELRAAENQAIAHAEELQKRDDYEYALNNRITELQEAVNYQEALYARANHTINVMVANERFRAGTMADLRAAVDLLALVDLEGQPFDIIATAQHIREDAFPRLATHYATGGIASFNAGDYPRAVIQLEDARLFIEPFNPQFPHLLYHLGTLYYRAPNRREEAIATLRELTALDGYENFAANPWGPRRTRVQTMLANLGA